MVSGLNIKELLKKEIPKSSNSISSILYDVLDLERKEIENDVDRKIEEIINELPKGRSSSIAPNLYRETSEDGMTIYVITDNIIWDYLDKGTGIYNPEYAGKGEGGAIVPVNVKALHFKNREISVALGFPDVNIFLKKVRGIRPRWFFDRKFRL